MRTIFILMDSLRRDMLACYGGRAITPNIDRLAGQGVVFDNHCCASMPCMPARRDMLTGRYTFLEAPWGPVEPWDQTLPAALRQQKNVYSHMITDHYHYFHDRGEGYHDLYDSWHFERGQERDAWIPVIHPSANRAWGRAADRPRYWANQTAFDTEDEASYPSNRCCRKAAEFLELNQEEDDWFLHLELFNPHEPFDVPKQYLKMYGDTFSSETRYNWPDYACVKPEDKGEIQNHVINRYLASLTMTDHYLGLIFDRMDEYSLWKDTAVILTTDHGYLLGEGGFWAKNYMRPRRELFHIPMICHLPGNEAKAGSRNSTLTSLIDLPETILDLHGSPGRLPDAHGVSFREAVFEGEKNLHPNGVLYGYFAKEMNLCDGQYSYSRSPERGFPCCEYVYNGRGSRGINQPEGKYGHFLPHAGKFGHFEVEHPSGLSEDNPAGINLISDMKTGETIEDQSLETSLIKKMELLLTETSAPSGQKKRLGL